MTEPLDPSTPDEPTPDETFTWTNDGGPDDAGHASGDAGPTGHGASQSAASTTATAILESLREAVDDLAERATPDRPRVLRPRGRAGRSRRGPGRAAGPAGRRGDVGRERQAGHEVAHLGRRPPRLDRFRGRPERRGRSQAGAGRAAAPGAGCRDRTDRRAEPRLISHAILRA